MKKSKKKDNNLSRVIIGTSEGPLSEKGRRAACRGAGKVRLGRPQSRKKEKRSDGPNPLGPPWGEDRNLHGEFLQNSQRKTIRQDHLRKEPAPRKADWGKIWEAAWARSGVELGGGKGKTVGSEIYWP